MASEITNSFKNIQRIGKLSRDGVCVFDVKENRFTYLNAAFIKILEINKKVLMVDPNLIMGIIPEDDRDLLKLRFNELLARESIEDVQLKIIQNKVVKTVSINCYLTADRSCVLGFVRDITKPMEHEEYLINYGAKKDTIMDMVSQNLATPLNLSKFTVDLIEKAVKERKFSKLDAHVAVMREVTQECIRIINEFMKEEHLESPTIHVKSNRFDLIMKVMIVLDELKRLHPEKQLTFRSDVQHLFFTGDDVKFFQIVHNILSNSMKFTADRGQVLVAVRNYKGRVEIDIKDDGIGIPEALKPYVYDKNTRAARPGLKGEASNGIGLHICKRLTEMMGGEISFESREGKGTRFFLMFPKK